MQKKSLTCLFVITLCYSASVAQTLKLGKQHVDLGILEIGELKETIVQLKNTTDCAFVVGDITTTCGCLAARMDRGVIEPGITSELKISTMKKIGGGFSYSIMVLPKNSQLFEPIEIEVSGTVRETLLARVGSTDVPPFAMSKNKPTDIGPFHRSASHLIIHVTAKERDFSFQQVSMRISSTFFEVSDCNVVPLAQAKDLVEPISQEQVVAALRPKAELKVGMLKDIIGLELSDGKKLYIPIVCQVVGDVFGDQSLIYFGRLVDSTTKSFGVHFRNGMGVWHDVRWNVGGVLSDVLEIERVHSSDSDISLVMRINQSAIGTLPKGYCWSRVRFYQNDCPEDAVSVVVAGTN